MKNPKLKFKYAEGLGDLVAATLHCKAFGWLTKLITGKDEPCKTCSQRIQALNFLFPINFWRFFFKNRQDLLVSLQNDLNEFGYKFNKNHKEVRVSSITEIKPKIENNIEGYLMVSSNDQQLENYLLRVQIFKKK